MCHSHSFALCNKTHCARLADLAKKSSLFRFALLGFHYISDLFINNQLRLAVVLYAQRAPLRMRVAHSSLIFQLFS